MDGLIGQNGMEPVVMYAAYARATQSNICTQPRATRGCLRLEAIDDPRLDPIPSPTRKTARMRENV